MVARALGLSAVWLASIAPLVIPAAAEHFSDVSRLALAALPWIAVLGLPRARLAASREALDAHDDAFSEPARSRGRNASRRPRTSSAFGTILLAIPPLALALAIDLAAGIGTARTIVLACLVVLALALGVAAAERAARTASARRAHAIAWLVLVPGLPALVAALELGGASAYGSAPRWLAAVAGAGPIAWIVRVVGANDVAVAGTPSALDVVPDGSLAAFSIALVLLAVAEIAVRVEDDVGDRDAIAHDASLHGERR